MNLNPDVAGAGPDISGGVGNMDPTRMVAEALAEANLSMAYLYGLLPRVRELEAQREALADALRDLLDHEGLTSPDESDLAADYAKARAALSAVTR